MTNEAAMPDDRTIPPEFKLPCDFIVGRTRFRKGVSLETVRSSAERWWQAAAAAAPFNKDAPGFKELLDKITPENLHPET